jgi:AraC family transcriptional regulator of adaptative response/methylated-DNA-[protein]-cysteine methyltransferase
MERRAIGFHTQRCALGWLGVAGTRRGVCAVLLADTRTGAAGALRDEFPWAEPGPAGPRLTGWAAGLAALAEGRLPPEEIPLDVRGSRFQRRVWDALRGIPRGETRSYDALARELGLPRGARAVARACATNPVALAVPCHRVVGGDGALRGYRWGAGRKRALLVREKESDLSLSSEGLASGCAGCRAVSAA